MGSEQNNYEKMRVFYQEWRRYDAISSSVTTKLKYPENAICSSPTTQLYEPNNKQENLASFLSIPFTHHYEIILKIKSEKQRWYYINKVASELWTVRHLKTEFKNKSHQQTENLPNNFNKTLTDNLYNKAIRAFKDQYLLDFVNVEDADEEIDERILEHGIVQNIKKFLMSLGRDFSFMGNQYRLTVDGDEYFIDLLFFHRGLQALVAFELKKGKFKPEYVGKMNFYLSALDDFVKQPHENPSIGIILCKEKNNKKVEYSFRDLTKPMGVAVFKTSEKLPAKYKKALPSPEELKRLLD